MLVSENWCKMAMSTPGGSVYLPESFSFDISHTLRLCELGSSLFGEAEGQSWLAASRDPGSRSSDWSWAPFRDFYLVGI